jgi:hypothetical protein
MYWGASGGGGPNPSITIPIGHIPAGNNDPTNPLVESGLVSSISGGNTVVVAPIFGTYDNLLLRSANGSSSVEALSDKLAITSNFQTGTVGQVLTADGSGKCDWENPSVPGASFPTSACIPVTAFNFYNRWADNAVEWWYQTNLLNSPAPVAGTNGQDMGTVNVPLAAGNYRCTAVAYCDNTNGGIMNIIFNGTTVSIDTKSVQQIIARSWATTIAADGVYTLQVKNNGSSGAGYDISFGSQTINIFQL